MSIEKIVNAMHEYQKMNNVKGCCVTNATILYDILRLHTPINVKVKAVYALSYDTRRLFEGHVVISVGNDKLIEPSWEVKNLKDVVYFDSISKLLKANKEIDPFGIDPQLIPNMIKNYIYFEDVAHRINNGEILITANEHYYKQLGYLRDFLIQQKRRTFPVKANPPCKGSYLGFECVYPILSSRWWSATVFAIFLSFPLYMGWGSFGTFIEFCFSP